MRDITITYTGPGQFHVKSKKKESEDTYLVDTQNLTCTCKSWYYSKEPKNCVHLKSVLAAVKDKLVVSGKEKHEAAAKNEVSEDFQILFNGG